MVSIFEVIKLYWRNIALSLLYSFIITLKPFLFVVVFNSKPAKNSIYMKFIAICTSCPCQMYLAYLQTLYGLNVNQIIYNFALFNLQILFHFSKIDKRILLFIISELSVLILPLILYFPRLTFICRHWLKKPYHSNNHLLKPPQTSPAMPQAHFWRSEHPFGPPSILLTMQNCSYHTWLFNFFTTSSTCRDLTMT